MKAKQAVLQHSGNKGAKQGTAPGGKGAKKRALDIKKGGEPAAPGATKAAKKANGIKLSRAERLKAKILAGQPSAQG